MNEVVPEWNQKVSLAGRSRKSSHTCEPTVVADALSRPPTELPEPSLNHDTQVSLAAVHNCDSQCGLMSVQLRRHSVNSAALRNLPVHDQGMILDDLDVHGGEAYPVGVRQTQTRQVVKILNVEITVSSVHLSDTVKNKFQNGYKSDKLYKEVWKGKQASDLFVKRNGLIYLRSKHAISRLRVPSVDDLITSIIREFHDSATSAHPGIKRTQFKIAQWYFWPCLEKDIRDYVTTCETCVRWKSNGLKKAGKMIPIPTPTECWEVVSMDFITGLPVSNGFDAIMTVVDKFSKRPKYVAVHTTADAPRTARDFFENVVRHRGLPKVIISDRDPKFTSNFWRSLMNIMGIKIAMTMAYRAQADGQTERQNLVLEDAIRCMVSYHGGDWSAHLGTIEYAHAASISAATGLTPFELDTGRKVANIVSQELEKIGRSAAIPFAEYAKDFVAKRQEHIDMAKKNLTDAQERQKRYYDAHRRAVDFKAGDMVMLDTRNLPLRHVTENTNATGLVTRRTRALRKRRWEEGHSGNAVSRERGGSFAR
ncbi:hypothetical protein FI667_g15122, partial [Globisporangium splendens]